LGWGRCAQGEPIWGRLPQVTLSVPLGLRLNFLSASRQSHRPQICQGSPSFLQSTKAGELLERTSRLCPVFGTFRTAQGERQGVRT